MKIEVSEYTSAVGNVTVYRLTNASGASVELSTLGAGVLSVDVPDRAGRLSNVALSYADPADYYADGPCLGKCPGRYANRIAKGRFTLDGVEYTLPVNNGPNHLHGGPDGYQNRIWKAEPLADGVRFSLHSPDGDAGYPGNLDVAVTYRWSDDNVLSLEFEASTDKPTVVNLTNHTYWNLRGADAGSVLGHKMRMNASRYLPTDDTLIPVGELAPVAGTPMDFTEEKELGRDIREDFPALNYGKGYDACWAIDRQNPGVVEAVVLSDEECGRRLTVSTDQPGVQIYTGNWLAGSPANRSGKAYEDYEGVAIEAQGFPDAPNHEVFPGQRLDPGTPYRRTIRFAFTTF